MLSLILEVLARALPFFLLVGAGVTLARLQLFDGRMAQGLSAYVYWIGFPALLVHSLSRMGRPGHDLTLGLAAYAGCLAAIMALMVGAGLLLRWTREERAGTAMAAGVGNSAFLGLPVAAAVFGPEIARLGAGLVAVDFVLATALGVALLGWAGGRSVWRSTMQAFRNPIVAAALFGASLALLGLQLPGVLDRAVGAAAASGSPVALVALGVVLALPVEGDIPAPRWSPVVVAAIAKLLVLPALVWIVVGLTPAPAAFRLAATLLAATPTAVNVFIQTRAYAVFARGGARIVALTTVIACVTLSATAVWLKS
ncbi:AEC family transporter [Caulobacter hibisci]|uniref:AEC family transporter n=1 Tax=Caulobacter hibisci TaxID=2035993 RepID=A0ABS0T1F4_9CAUL|nr:AEC family transporter [Caulobacter hibisci]